LALRLALAVHFSSLREGDMARKISLVLLGFSFIATGCSRPLTAAEKGALIGGAVGGQAAPKPVVAKMLPPQLGALQKESGADPEFPAVLRRAGMVYTVLTKICVSRSGNVESVSLLKGAESLLDRNVLTAVKGWRYRPLLADNNAIPFCYFGRFEFKAN